MKYFIIILFLINTQFDALGQKAKPAVKRIAQEDPSLKFILMGDWGRNGEDHQTAVARQMGITAAALKTDFIISTGDNFYPKGVVSEFDPLWKYSFEDVYTAFSLQWDWFPVLGNHDYMGDPDAQVAYSKISRRWQMPSRYYSKKFKIKGSDQEVLIAFIDTNPLIKEFYSNASYGPNVASQDSTAQKEWLIKTLSDDSPNIKWKIVVGHHPMFTGGRVDGYDTKAIRGSLKKVLEEHGVHAYLTGHDHSLQHLGPINGVHHFVSGSASEATPSRALAETKFTASEYGFIVFSITEETIAFEFIDEHGQVLYAERL